MRTACPHQARLLWLLAVSCSKSGFKWSPPHLPALERTSAVMVRHSAALLHSSRPFPSVLASLRSRTSSILLSPSFLLLSLHHLICFVIVMLSPGRYNGIFSFVWISINIVRSLLFSELLLLTQQNTEPSIFLDRHSFKFKWKWLHLITRLCISSAHSQMQASFIPIIPHILIFLILAQFSRPAFENGWCFSRRCAILHVCKLNGAYL